jgi:hypothetical protein
MSIEAVKNLRENPKVDLSKILYGVSSDNLAANFARSFKRFLRQRSADLLAIGTF